MARVVGVVVERYLPLSVRFASPSASRTSIPFWAVLRPTPQARAEHRDGELVELASRSRAIAEDHKNFYRELRAVAQMRGYKDGWVGYKFKDRYGTFPPREYSHLPPMAPSDATFRWVKSRSIAWAKSRNNPVGPEATA